MTKPSKQEKSKPQPPKDTAYAPVQLPRELVEWLRAQAKADGVFLYRKIENLIAAGLKGKRPWLAK